MGKQSPEATQTRHRYVAAVMITTLIPAPLYAACPGAGCPAISMDIDGLQECPGPGCPAFEETVRDQQHYIDIFGGLQSGSDEPRPLEERLLLAVEFDDADHPTAEIAPVLDGTCKLLLEVGAYEVEVLGLSDALTNKDAQRASNIASALRMACNAACATDQAYCPQISTRPAGPSDALPRGLGLEPDQTLIELHLLP